MHSYSVSGIPCLGTLHMGTQLEWNVYCEISVACTHSVSSSDYLFLGHNRGIIMAKITGFVIFCCARSTAETFQFIAMVGGNSCACNHFEP